MKMLLTGNYAAAYGAKLARVEVVAAYPITPQSPVVEKLSEFVEKGELRAEYIAVESEHSALAACVGAEACGARTFTATSSHGLLYMTEMIFWTALARLPIVMAIITRTIGPPWNIWSDHNDILSVRDSGWIIMLCEDNQEVLDSIIQAYRIAEDERVLLPVMVGLDGFLLSHTAAVVDVPDSKDVDGFLPQRDPAKPFFLDVDNPFTMGGLTFPDQLMEFRYLVYESMERSKEVISEVDRKYRDAFGRSYGGMVEKYKCEDAEIVFAVMGSLAGEAKDATDLLREEGIEAGVLKVRCIRPFPRGEIIEVADRVKAMVVVDRNVSFGLGGILASELKSVLLDLRKPPVTVGFIAGIGGRDVDVDDFRQMALTTIDVIEGRRHKPEKTPWVKLKKEVLS